MLRCSKRLDCQPSSSTLPRRSCSAAARSRRCSVRWRQMREEFHRLYESRRPCYLKAMLRVETAGKDVEEVAAEAISRLGFGIGCNRAVVISSRLNFARQHCEGVQREG